MSNCFFSFRMFLLSLSVQENEIAIYQKILLLFTSGEKNVVLFNGRLANGCCASYEVKL